MNSMFCYQACLDGVRSAMDYEETFKGIATKYIGSDIGNIISLYYEPFREYSYAMGHSVDKDRKKEVDIFHKNLSSTYHITNDVCK